MVCNEIVYKNENKSNCITNDTGFLTVPTSSASQLSKNRYTDTGATFEIELDYYSAIEKEIEKFDQHLNAYIASTLGKKSLRKLQFLISKNVLSAFMCWKKMLSSKMIS